MANAWEVRQTKKGKARIESFHLRILMSLLCKKSWILWSTHADPGVGEMREASSSMPLIKPGTSVAHLITLSFDFYIHRKGIHVALCYSDAQ